MHNAQTSNTTRMFTTSSNMVKFPSDSNRTVQSQLLELQTDTQDTPSTSKRVENCTSVLILQQHQ